MHPVPENIVCLPGVLPPAAPVAFDRRRSTVRITGWKQRRLPLRPHVPSLEERIDAARYMVGYYEENAVAERNATLKARYEGRVARWRRDLRELETERDAATAQRELLPLAAQCERPHTGEEAP